MIIVTWVWVRCVLGRQLLELPVPFAGQGQYTHQLNPEGISPGVTPGITPTNSGTSTLYLILSLPYTPTSPHLIANLLHTQAHLNDLNGFTNVLNGCIWMDFWPFWFEGQRSLERIFLGKIRWFCQEIGFFSWTNSFVLVYVLPAWML